MSNSRSPRAVRSMTIGISGMALTLALAASQPWVPRCNHLHARHRVFTNATRGKSEAGPIDARAAAKKVSLEARVKAGTITQAQADARLSKLVSRASARV